MATDKLVDFDHVTDYISRQAAINIVCHDDCEDCPDGGCDMYRRMKRLPTADARPVVRGRWIWNENGMDWGQGAWICSQCRNRPETTWQTMSDIIPLRWSGSHFCPNCGADMREPNLDTTKGDNHD